MPATKRNRSLAEPRRARTPGPSAVEGDNSRRERLIDVAIEMFTRYGVRKTSIDDIARAAQIAKGSVYLEFRSKNELFRAAAEQVASRIIAAAAAAAAGAGDLADRLTALLMAKFWRLYDLVHARPHATELIAAKDSIAADIFQRADEQFREIVVETLRAAIARSEWKPHASHDAVQIASVLLIAAHGTSYGAGPLDESAYRQRLQLSVELVLTGAAVPARRRRRR